jgi:peptide/nickel transport system substrate-binding protein
LAWIIAIRLTVSFSFCVLLLLTTACRGDEDPAVSRIDTVIIGTQDVTGLLPDSTGLEHMIFSPLAFFTDYVEMEPGLAHTWEDSPDGRTRTWHMRKDVHWHDGEWLTAHDVEFTFKLLSHPDVAIRGSFDNITVIDDFTIQISTDRHDYYYDLAIYPRHLLEEFEPTEAIQGEFWTHPVGSGPYRFVRYLRDQSMELEANPDYFKGEAHIKHIQLKFIGKQGGVTEALSGNVDILYPSEPSDWPILEKGGQFRSYHTLWPGGIGLYFNHRHSLFADPLVRRAIALAIDRRTILKAIGLPSDVPLTNVLFTARQFLRGQLPAPLPYDPDRARNLLDKAGWIDENGDGIREKDGITARFSLMQRPPGKRAVLIQNYLRQIGLKAEIENVDLAVVWERMSAANFEAAVHVYQDWEFWDARFFGRESITGYSNPCVAEALDRAVRTANLDIVDELYLGIQEQIAHDVPMVLLQPWVQVYFVHRRIHGLQNTINFDPIANMNKLWIEEEKE